MPIEFIFRYEHRLRILALKQRMINSLHLMNRKKIKQIEKKRDEFNGHDYWGPSLLRRVIKPTRNHLTHTSTNTY